MKLIKVLKGWHKLRKGTLIRKGDRYLWGSYWRKADTFDRRVGWQYFGTGRSLTYIRKNKAKGGQ